MYTCNPSLIARLGLTEVGHLGPAPAPKGPPYLRGGGRSGPSSGAERRRHVHTMADGPKARPRP